MTAQLTDLDTPESAEMLRWRLRVLLDAGYRYADAVKLALAGEVDLHAATRLLRRGCPSSRGVRILL